MALITEALLRSKAGSASGFIYESNIRNFSAAALANETRMAAAADEFDIFLSHAFEDAILIKGLRDLLDEAGYSVYVDWIDDPQFERKFVSRYTAAGLKRRMLQCKSLLFATSEAAKKSVWMPWELGFMDSQTNSRVAIAPIVPSRQQFDEFRGQEYLGIYPYLDRTGQAFYIHTSSNVWINFKDWLQGNNPVPH
jgi:hypothetical protein